GSATGATLGSSSAADTDPALCSRAEGLQSSDWPGYQPADFSVAAIERPSAGSSLVGQLFHASLAAHSGSTSMRLLQVVAMQHGHKRSCVMTDTSRIDIAL